MFSEKFKKGVALAEAKALEKGLFKGWSLWGGEVVRYAVKEYLLDLGDQAELEDWLAELYPDTKRAIEKDGGSWNAQALIYVYNCEVFQEVYDEVMEDMEDEA